MKCSDCPRNCGAERDENIGTGFCRSPESPVVAKASLHYWEEPCISGKSGSGTVFFSGCSLKCVYCQNYEISAEGFGKKISTERLAEIFRELESKGAENINLVNPTHYSSAILKAFEIYKPEIPIVYNCSGYEKIETLKKFEGIADVYLTDLKYFDGDISLKYSRAADYFEKASAAVKEMLRQQPMNVFDENGMMKKGVIIRHLVLPNNLKQTRQILGWIRSELPENVLISVMSQYIPHGNAAQYKEINRRLTQREYDKVLDMIDELGFEDGFVQELSSSSEEFIPPFDLEGV